MMRGQRVIEKPKMNWSTARPDALGQHVESQLTHIGGGLAQGIDAIGEFDGLDGSGAVRPAAGAKSVRSKPPRSTSFGIDHEDVANAEGWPWQSMAS